MKFQSHTYWHCALDAIIQNALNVLNVGHVHLIELINTAVLLVSGAEFEELTIIPTGGLQIHMHRERG